MNIYLDCNATTPMDQETRDIIWHFMTEEYGNAGSRTHEFGNRANKAVQRAREEIAKHVACGPDEVIFTSGATESNNLAILGLSAYGISSGKKHIISSRLEHKAVLEPLEYMVSKGFEVTWLDVDDSGVVHAEQVKDALREETLLVSIMHANNETGTIQPIEDLCSVLEGHDAIFHTDAAQTFGKTRGILENKRLDLISISGHKIYGPMGIGVLINRRRGFKRLPLKPLFHGGGQERGLRPGTLPVPLIVGLGKAAELARTQFQARRDYCLSIRKQLLEKLTALDYSVNGDSSRCLPHVLNISINDLDSEAVMLALKGLVAISNGSACTSRSYSPSHVLEAMGLDEKRVDGALRISWCHLTESVDWDAVIARIRSMY